MPGELGEDAGLDAVFRVGAAVEVLGVERLALGVGEKVLIEIFEVLFALFAIAVPPHGVLGRRVDDGVLVLRRTAGVMAGLGAERAAGDDGRLAVADRVLVERGCGEVPMDRFEVLQAEFVGAVGTVPYARLLHPSLRKCARGERACDPISERPSICQDATLLKPNWRIPVTFRRDVTLQCSETGVGNGRVQRAFERAFLPVSS